MLALLTGALLASGCVAFDAPVKVPGGLLYQHTRAPLQTDVEGLDLGTRSGSAKTRYIRVMLPWPADFTIAWEDASIAAAARDGGIETVKHVDYEVLSILRTYVELTVHVYGD
jgi:hypothetical protein